MSMVHASLFSGIGGPEVAAAMLGWRNAFHCEINPFGRAVLEYWFPDSESYEDIYKCDFRKWRGQVDVLTGGFPCQPFSYAGKRVGAEDNRYLWPQMLRAIDEIRPSWVVGENVAGITTMVEGGVLADLGGQASLFEEGDELHGYELEQSFTIERVCGDLERIGYSVQPMLIPAAACGAPHRRDRIFIIAYADSDLRRPGTPEEGGRPDGERGGGYVFPAERGCEAQRPNGLSSIQRSLADSDSRDDVRVPGADGCDGEEERIQERDEILLAGKSSGLRSKVQGTTENAMRDGRIVGRLGKQRGKRNERDAGARSKERVCGTERIDSTISEDGGLKSGNDSFAGRKTSDGSFGQFGRIGDAADTDLQRCHQSESTSQPSKEERFHCEEVIDWGDGSLRPERRWAFFPTVSPIHRGNDGLPFPLDNLTISEGKWRTESLKAYGNAIVPQVMYRIFQAIESVTPKQ